MFDCFLDAQKENFFKYQKQVEHQPLQAESCCLHVVRLVVCSFPQQPFGLSGAAQEPKGQQSV